MRTVEQAALSIVATSCVSSRRSSEHEEAAAMDGEPEESLNEAIEVDARRLDALFC